MATNGVSARKIAKLVKGTGKGMTASTTQIGKLHKSVPGKGKVSTTQLNHGMNSRQAGC